MERGVLPHDELSHGNSCQINRKMDRNRKPKTAKRSNQQRYFRTFPVNRYIFILFQSINNNNMYIYYKFKRQKLLPTCSLICTSTPIDIHDSPPHRSTSDASIPDVPCPTCPMSCISSLFSPVACMPLSSGLFQSFLIQTIITSENPHIFLCWNIGVIIGVRQLPRLFVGLAVQIHFDHVIKLFQFMLVLFVYCQPDFLLVLI